MERESGVKCNGESGVKSRDKVSEKVKKVKRKIRMKVEKIK